MGHLAPLRDGIVTMIDAKHVEVGRCKLNSVDPYLESAWFQQINLIK
jgi:hypothetical protein